MRPRRPASWLLLPALCAFLPLGAAPACAEEAWEELERAMDPEEPADLEAARQRLAPLGAEAWLVLRERTPLRLALAESLSAAEVGALVDEAVAEPGRLVALALNLASRADVPGLLLPEPRLDALAAADPGALEDLVEELTVAGRPELGLALLARAPLTRRLGAALADLAYAAGPQALADALTVPGRLPEPARASLADVRPDLWNRYVERPLGAERIGRLLACARSDPDAGLRALAARLLHASLDPQGAQAVLPAYLGASSWRIDADEWEQLGSNRGLLPGYEGLPLGERLALLHGALVRGGHVRAGNDPEGAEQVAREMRALLARTGPPAEQAALARLLGAWGGTLFVDGGHARPWAAPSWVALVDGWGRASHEGGPLASLHASLAAAARRDLGRPWPRGPARRLVERPPPQVPLESDPERVRAWTRSQRRALGRRWAASPDGLAAQARGALLADDDVALGYALQGLAAPVEPALAFASQILTGTTARPALRQALVDGGGGFGPTLDLAPTDGQGGRLRFPLENALRTALGRVVAEDPDPWAVDAAAQRLALAGTDADVAILLRHAARLGLLEGFPWRSPLSALAPTVLEPDEEPGRQARLALLLGALTGPTLAPAAAGELFEALVEALFEPQADVAERARREPLASRLLAWFAVQAPRLPPDLVERAVLALLDGPATADEGWAVTVGTLVRAVVAEVGVLTLRLRLQARAEAAWRRR